MSRAYSQVRTPIAVVINGLSVWLIFEETWEHQVRMTVFPFVIWLHPPAAELRELVLSRIAQFPERERREEWLCEKPEGRRA